MLTVPASKKFRFMNAPASKAGIVAAPKINPIPTNTSPQGIKMLNTFTFGRANVSRNVAYQPWTAG